MPNRPNTPKSPRTQHQRKHSQRKTEPKSSSIPLHQSRWTMLIFIPRVLCDSSINNSSDSQANRLAELGDSIKDASRESLRLGRENGCDEQVRDGEETVCTCWVESVG